MHARFSAACLNLGTFIEGHDRSGDAAGLLPHAM